MSLYSFVRICNFMEKGTDTYFNKRNHDLLIKTRAIVNELPVWFSDFIRSIDSTTSALTRYNYSCDTRIFLSYLSKENPAIAGTPLHEITIKMIDDLTLRDLEIYVEYVGYYITSNKKDTEIELSNSEYGKARKIASLRSLFKYLYKRQLISDNPAALLDTPKIHDKAIIRLDYEESRRLINVIRSGEGLTPAQLKFHPKTFRRDIAIAMMFLTTGIRVSELVGLNINDVNFENMSFIITRKGGNQAILYFDYETQDALDEYLEERRNTPYFTQDSPLFLSLQNKRMTVLSVENMIKKYARIAAPLKKITPHKLRSTYGTMLYNETGDIYLVADVLGHKDVNTTRKHYAHMLEDNRKLAAKSVKIFKEDEE